MNKEVVSTVSSDLLSNSMINSLLAGLNMLVPTATTSGKALSNIEIDILYL